MTVTAIVGSLRMLPTRTPVEILRELNQSLAGNLRGGFVTCLAMRINADGAVTLANAGHLAPYRNGAEFPLPPACLSASSSMPNTHKPASCIATQCESWKCHRESHFL